MKFAILTTTHKRPTELQRALDSARSQSFTDYVHYIVNDSPEHDYSEVEKNIISDPKIIYTKNTENIGKNASLNKLLGLLAQKWFSGHVVYLDDDDWFAPECLEDFKSEIEKNPNCFWFVSNRVLLEGESLTKNNTGKKFISYFYDYLLSKKFTGDATHCIKFSTVSKTHYPKHIKNGEEWYYFLSISKDYKKFLHIDKPGTYTRGYSTNGQNAVMKQNYRGNTPALFKEVLSPAIFVYLILRTLTLLFKKTF